MAVLNNGQGAIRVRLTHSAAAAVLEASHNLGNVQGRITADAANSRIDCGLSVM